MPSAINFRTGIAPIVIGALIAFLGSVLVGAAIVAIVSLVKARMGMDPRPTYAGSVLALLVGCLMYAAGGFVGSRLAKHKPIVSALWIGTGAVLVDIAVQGATNRQILTGTVIYYALFVLAALFGGWMAYHFGSKSNKAFERTP